MPGVRDYPHRLKRPLRDVQALVSSEGGVRPYALASADVEPLPHDADPAAVFVNDVPDAELPPRFGAAFGEGVLAKLAEWSWRGVPAYAVRVRLRDARWREGESTEAGFAWAGRRAALELDRCFHARVRPRPYLLHWPPPRTTAHRAPEHDVPLARPVAARGTFRDIHVRMATVGGCGGYAVATADFEPPAAGSGVLFEFVSALDEDRLPHELADAFERGVHETLCAFGTRRMPTVAFRVRLRDARWSETDSGPTTFAQAGRRAATEALRRHDALEVGR
ncbi:hypothetical protein AB0B12_17790 [Streptomyces sp. NPDC044780]|uniref:hypothetical protein n=1 Tax=unclassified Streptomyces TaxID=2593676 RepID=UPI00340C7A9A